MEVSAFYIAGFTAFKSLWNTKIVIYNNNAGHFPEELKALCTL